MENSGKVPMVLIEVQTRTYLEEDDIIHYDDVYARSQEAKGLAASPIAKLKTSCGASALILTPILAIAISKCFEVIITRHGYRRPS